MQKEKVLRRFGKVLNLPKSSQNLVKSALTIELK